MCYLLDHWFIVKGCNSGTGRWKRCLGKGMWETVQSVLAWSRSATLHASPRVHGHQEALVTLFPRVFMETALHSHDQFGDWFNLLSLPWSIRWVGLKVPTLKSLGCFYWQPVPILRSFPQVSSLTSQKTPFSLSTLRKFQEFQELQARNCGQRPNICFV